MPSKPKLPNERRVIKAPAGLSPAKRAGYVLKQRQKDLASQGVRDFDIALHTEMQKRAAGIKGKSRVWSELDHYEWHPEDGKERGRGRIYYLGDPFKLAHAKVSITKRHGKPVLVIDEVQGASLSRERHTNFQAANAKSAREALYDMLVSSAYESGFDRALLMDVTKSKDYQDPYMGLTNRTETEVRTLMKKTYDEMREKGGFNEREDRFYYRRRFSHPP
jgi:hypothetical protein